MNPHIVQILPALNEGGVERGTVEISRELVKRGRRASNTTAGVIPGTNIKYYGTLTVH
jgi:hypothetical protein